MGTRFIRIDDEAKTFESALATVVRIVDKEGFKAPTVEITPKWLVSGGGAYIPMSFDIMVSTTLDGDTGEEITEDVERYMK